VTRKSKKSATPLQHWVAWKIASRAKELGVVSGRSEQEALDEAYKQFEITTPHDKRRLFLRRYM
jgi:hypothetical protein